jgi:hypothetical protein
LVVLKAFMAGIGLRGTHMQRRHHVGHATAAFLIAAGVGLSGCGGVDGVELNGAMFDWMGVSPSAQAARRNEPAIADRAPLVIPPDVNKLPPPGSGQQPAVAMAWPDDPEARKSREASERHRLHMAYCSGEIQWKERALDPNGPRVNRSPFGPCPGLSGFTTNVNKE